MVGLTIHAWNKRGIDKPLSWLLQLSVGEGKCLAEMNYHALLANVRGM